MAQGATKTLEEKKQAKEPALHIETRYVNIGKIPGGEIQEVQLNGKMTLGDLFEKISVSNFAGCEIQRNGKEAKLGDLAEAGDTILAVAKIRGNQ